MDIKKRIYTELDNPNFPDLTFLYSQEVLDIAEEVLEELLEADKKDFEKKLLIKDNQITFETFEEFSPLAYFFGLLEHYQGVNNDDTIRKIIENFEPKYIDFGNEVAYSERYYKMLTYYFENGNPNEEEKRILKKSIESYEVRGIALPEDKQEQLKKINKQLSELSQTFGNNVLDSQKEFEYVIEDEDVISQMPQDDKSVAKQKAEKKNTQ